MTKKKETEIKIEHGKKSLTETAKVFVILEKNIFFHEKN